MVLSVGRCGFGMIGKALSPLAPLCKGELLLQCEALPTIEGLLTEVSEKRKGCGRKAITPVVARIFSGDSTSPLTREARTWCGARDSAGLGGLVRIGNNPSGSRPILLGDSTSPLTREASLARGEAVDVPLRRLWGLRGSVGVKQSLR